MIFSKDTYTPAEEISAKIAFGKVSRKNKSRDFYFKYLS